MNIINCYLLPFPLGWVCALAKIATLVALRLMIVNCSVLNLFMSVRNFSISFTSILSGAKCLEMVRRDATILCCWKSAKCFSM